MARIVFDHVTKRYPGSQRGAVDDVNLTVPEGSLCMLLGTSGSGKTTLLRMVNRLIDPTSGQILIDDTPTTSQDPIELRRSIGYVIQQIGLFPHMTIAQNVRVVPSITGNVDYNTDARVDELLHLVGLEPSEFRNRYPRQLSGGQQQRVGLARALAADPAVLLMDEPFGALDAITRERVQEQLRNIHRSMRKTILFVTHDVEEALKLGDQIAVIVDGKLLQADTPIALLTNPVNDVVRRLIGGDNILRQFEYIPVTQALEPITVADGERLPSDTVLLTALLRLLQTQADALIIEDAGKPIGQITFATIYRGLRADSPTATPATGDQVPATN